MRSGSSLLLHLLMANSEISGQGERNRAYTGARDLDTFAIKSNLARRDKWRATISVDQVNHTRFLLDESLLEEPKVLPVILVREPRAAIGSMVQTFNRIRNFPIEEGIAHYAERVSTLARYAHAIAAVRPLCALTYDQLVTQSDATLLRLQVQLSLREPLGKSYPTYEFTGTRGDPSERIRAGTILPARHDHGVQIDPAALAGLQSTYETCLAACGLDE